MDTQEQTLRSLRSVIIAEEKKTLAFSGVSVIIYTICIENRRRSFQVLLITARALLSSAKSHISVDGAHPKSLSAYR